MRARTLVLTSMLLLGLWPAVGTAQAVPNVPRAAQMQFGGVTRTYEVHVPPGVTQPTGLVLNLHAGGATGRDQANLTHYDAVADNHGFVVVHPDGIDRSWADGRGASVPDRQGVDDVGFLSALAGDLMTRYGIAPGRVYVTGLSAGAFMANRLACDRADLFAAIAPVAGTLGVNAGCAPSRPVAVLAIYGTQDPIVPFDGGPMVGRGGPSTIVSAPAMVGRWSQFNGCQGAPVDETLPGAGGPVTHRISYRGCAAPVEFMRVDGGGHTWPGAPEILPAQAVGAASQGFDASEATWQFFDRSGR